MPRSLARTIERAAAPLAKVRPVADAREAAAAMPRKTRCVLVAVPPKIHAAVRLKHIAILHASQPLITIIAVYLPGSSSRDALLELGRQGVSEVVDSDPAHVEANLRRSIQRGVLAHGVASLAARLPTVTPFSDLLRRTALHVSLQGPSVGALAEALSLSERTLRANCTREGIESPQWFLRWARVLLATYHREQTTLPSTVIATLLHFGSARALNRQSLKVSAVDHRPGQSAARDVQALLALVGTRLSQDFLQKARVNETL